MAGLFSTVSPVAASAASIGELDLLGLLGLRGPAPAAPAAAPPVAAPPAGQVAPAPPPMPDATAIPPGSGAGRRVVYPVTQQRVWLVNEDGSLHGTWLVSGRAGEPNPGTYSVFSRSRHARAQKPGITMEYMVRFVRTAGLPIGFHSIPVNRRGVQIQTVEQLGTFQSLGCVRQRYEDAVVMWDFAQIGTPVVVLQ
jgi:lipoprotein-anchoring transpeptidase ErfK/SrfK